MICCCLLCDAVEQLRVIVRVKKYDPKVEDVGRVLGRNQGKEWRRALNIYGRSEPELLSSEDNKKARSIVMNRLTEQQ